MSKTLLDPTLGRSQQHVILARFLPHGLHAERPARGEREGSLYWCTDHNLLYIWDESGATWITTGSGVGAGVTLDGAYDYTTPGAGRTITADSGSVLIQNTDSDTNPVIELVRANAGDATLHLRKSADSQPTLEITGDGTIKLGPGSSTPPNAGMKYQSSGVVSLGLTSGAGGGIQVNDIYEYGANARVRFPSGIIIKKMLNMNPATTTLNASGQLTVTEPWMQVASNSGTSDDMDTILFSGMAGTEGDFFLVSPQATHTITIRDAGVSGGDIQTSDGNPIVLNAVEKVALIIRKNINSYYAFALGGSASAAALTVREEDGTPIDTSVTIIRVPNAGLVDNGTGDVSLLYELQGAVATHAAAADPHTPYLKADGTRALTGNMSVNAGVRIDDVDIGAHIHTGAAGMGLVIQHNDLGGFGPDDHHNKAHEHTPGDGGVLTNDEHDGFSEYAEIASPAPPATGKVRIYPKTDGKMYRKDDTGAEVELGGAGGGDDAMTRRAMVM